MLEQLRLLVRLQSIDKTLFDLLTEKDAIPGRLAELSQTETALAKRLEAAKARFDEVDKQRKNLEEIADNIRSRLRRAENRLMGAQSQREYQAANAEIDDNKDALKDNDNSLLEVMEKVEELERVVADLQEKYESASKELGEQRDLLEKRYLEVDAEAGRLEAKRGKITGEVDKHLLKEYDFIRQRREGIALAAVDNGICGVCHMGIPPQQYNELQRMDKIMNCPSCRRLIYWAQAEELQDPS